MVLEVPGTTPARIVCQVSMGMDNPGLVWLNRRISGGWVNSLRNRRSGLGAVTLNVKKRRTVASN